MSNKRLSRRDFLRLSGAAGAAMAGFSPLGNIARVGAQADKAINVLTVGDPWDLALQNVAEQFTEMTGRRWFLEKRRRWSRACWRRWKNRRASDSRLNWHSRRVCLCDSRLHIPAAIRPPQFRYQSSRFSGKSWAAALPSMDLYSNA